MTVKIQIGDVIRDVSRPVLPDPIPLHRNCLCPGCYFLKTPGSELCDRCTLDGCTNEENHHS